MSSSRSCCSVSTVSRTILLLGALLLFACRGEEVKKCHAEMTSAQNLVTAIDESSEESVEKSLSAVASALATCRAADRDEEVTELGKAHAQLDAHLKALKRRASDPSRKKLSAAELAELGKRGDRECPKGQAYTHRDSKQEIKCSGPQVVDMDFAQAEAYVKRRGYKRLPTGPNVVAGEYGAERLEFRFAVAGDTSGARCIIMHPKPTMSWQETVARLTGLRPDRVENGGTIKAARGPHKLAVDEEKLIIAIGECE